MKPWCRSVLSVATLALLGCSPTIPRYPVGTTLGTIVTTTPRLETRERLINDRREREYWLGKERDRLRQASQGVSGASAVTSSSYMGAQANLSFDPAYRMNSLNQARQIKSTQSALDDDRAIGRLVTAERDDIIARRQRGEITFAQASEELKALGYSVAPAAPASAASASAPGAATPPQSTYLDKDKGERIDAPTSGPERAQLSPTPVEDFLNKLAADEVVTNEINATRGDDGHDLGGNTLYRLTLDATVRPQQDTSAWAIVKVRLTPGSDFGAPQAVRLLDAAKDQYLRELLQANEALYRGMLNNLKRQCWQQEVQVYPELPMLWRQNEAGGAGNTSQLAAKVDEESTFRRAFLCASDSIGSNNRRMMERHLAAWSPQTGAATSKVHERMEDLLLERPRPRESIEAFSARRKTLQSWSGWLAKVFDAHLQAEFARSPISCYFSLTTDANVGGIFPVKAVRLSDQSAARHCASRSHQTAGFMQSLLENMQSSVYGVTPKESVQQISELSATRRTRELLIGLAGSTGNLGLSAALQAIQANTAQFEAIRRQPLVVGFTEKGRSGCVLKDGKCTGTLEFGWILGPSFALSGNGAVAGFRHAMTQKSVAATISVPAWLKDLKVEIQTSWMQENGVEVHATDDKSKAVWTPYANPLTPNHALAFAGLGDDFQREPKVDAFQYLDVNEGEPATVMITGSDLWRSTEVYLGAQKADVVSNLPNYGGVTAKFDKIASAGGRRDERRRIYLTLYTSEGDVLAGAASVIEKGGEKKESKPLTATGMRKRVIAGVPQAVMLSAALSSSEDAVVRIDRTEVQGFSLLLADSTVLSDDRKSISFTPPADASKTLASGTKLSVALLVDRGRGGVERIQLQDPAIFYASLDAAKASATITGKLTSKLAVTVSLPPAAAMAFGDLAGGQVLLAGTATLDGGITTFALGGTCKIEKDACSATLSGDAAWTAALAKAKAASVKLNFDGKDAPELRSDTLTAKR